MQKRVLQENSAEQLPTESLKPGKNPWNCLWDELYFRNSPEGGVEAGAVQGVGDKEQFQGLGHSLKHGEKLRDWSSNTSSTQTQPGAVSFSTTRRNSLVLEMQSSVCLCHFTHCQ